MKSIKIKNNKDSNYSVVCKNCVDIIEFNDTDVDKQDLIYLDCKCCDCQNEIEIIYDEENNIIEFRVY
jgi:hypothetical protein